MTKFLGTAAVALIAAGTLAGCSSAEARAPEVQRAEIEATGSGFVPDTVRFEAGVPAELVFTRTGGGCASQVHIPELGVARTALPRGEPVVIAVGAPEAGVYEYRCGMDMLRGTIIVTPRAAR